MDLRVKKTKRLIRNTFIELAQEKHIEKITVKELTEKAEISKPTFYSHYETINDLWSELEDELIDEILEHIKGPSLLLTNPSEFLKKFSEGYYANPFASILWSGSLKKRFGTKIKEAVHNELETGAICYDENKNGIATIVLFVFYGVYGCIGKMGKEEFDNQIEELSYFLQNGISNKVRLR